MLSILSAGIAPGIALLAYFYLKDKYETEPIRLVIKTFIFGALLVFPVMVIQYAFHHEDVLQYMWSKSFLLSGFLEEFLKWFVVYYVAYQHVEFDERYDGIVYGASVSLGFASIENIFYLTSFGLNYALVRALLPVSSHALFGVIMGYYLGRAKFSSGRSQRFWITFSFLSVTVLHGMYDYILNYFDKWLYIMVPFMLYLWWTSLRKVKLAHV